MNHVDVFNGDADGITALLQWRMEYPAAAVLISGVKRDIELLSALSPCEEQNLSIFDISLKSNLRHLKKFLDKGVKITWFDHHQKGDSPKDSNLILHINETTGTCTSNIVNDLLRGKYAKWASVGAFGDNATELGTKLASGAGVRAAEIGQLENLGMLINYNSYGESLEDLHFNPLDVYSEVAGYKEPLDFIENSPMINALEAGFKDDLLRSDTVKSDEYGDYGTIYYLPDEKWARRIIGTFANSRSSESVGRAHAVLLRKKGGWLVSVRAPKNKPVGADTLCSSFDSGGGRAAAAGINFLSDTDFSSFADKFKESFS